MKQEGKTVASGSLGAIDIEPGAELRQRVAEQLVRGEVTIVALAVNLGPATAEKQRKQVVASGLLKAGVYYLTTRENDPGDRIPFAVAPDARESQNLEPLGDSEIDGQLGFAPVHVTVREDETPQFGAVRTNREWTAWLLWLVLALALGESVLAWLCGRAW